MNTKTYKQAFVVLAVSIFIVPQIAFAAWWNPFTWNIFFFNKAPKAQVQQIQNASTTQNVNAKTSATTKTEAVKSAAVPSVSTTKTTNKLSATTLTNSQIIKKVKPTVVYIETNAGTGSGMIISSDGFVLTNAHVVQNATTAKITLSSGSIYSASVVGRDENIDLAVLKVNAQNLAKVDFGDSDTAEQGDEVFTLGYPFGIKGDVSFKEGTISRKIVDGTNTYIETSAEIHPGNSGGPLVNAEGNVVGVNSASFGQSIKGVAVGETIKFAIPINVAKNLIPELKAGRQVIVPKTETPAASDPFQTDNAALKIEKCKAVRDSNRIKMLDESRVLVEEGLKKFQDQLLQQAYSLYSGTITASEIMTTFVAPQVKAKREKDMQTMTVGVDAYLNNEYTKCLNQ